MLRKTAALQPLILLCAILALASCATTLAPQYDKALVDGLTSANTTAMQLLASLSGGTQKDNFTQRKDGYAKVIGQFDALRIQARARPVPRSHVLDEINAALVKRGIPVPAGENGPSITAMAKISETFAKMRDTDEKQGLTAFEVQAFRNQVSIYMEQALTYESFLKR